MKCLFFVLFHLFYDFHVEAERMIANGRMIWCERSSVGIFIDPVVSTIIFY